MRKCNICSYKLMPADIDQCPQCGSRDILTIISNPESTNLNTNIDKNSNKIDDNLQKTIIGRQAQLIHNEHSSTNLHCNNCSYPINSNSDACPNCGINYTKQLLDMDMKRTTSLSDIANSMKELLPTKIKLIPLNHKDNLLEFDFYSKSEIELGRSDIDPLDESLSMQSHVLFSHLDGVIEIKNTSSNKAIFKQVKDQEILENDDLILLGKNKFYRVSIEKN